MADQPGFITALDDNRLLIRGKFTLDENRMRLTELTIKAVDLPGTEPFGEISASTLREIHLSQLVDVAKRIVARDAHFMTPEGQADAVAEIKADGGEARPNHYADEVVREAKRRIKLASTREQRGAARGRGDAFYRRVALDLIEIVESGKIEEGGALETLARVEARRLKQSEIPVQTVRTWLRVARERQFLAPAERGRLTVVPGPRLYSDETSK